jgi:VWFA-related protein
MLPLIVVVAAAAAVQQPPVFRVGVETVYLDVFVTRDGAPVEGLTTASFEVRDDGIPQSVEVVPVDSLPLRTVLVFDTSRSLGGFKLKHLRRAATRLLDHLRSEDPVEVLAFDEQLRVTEIKTSGDLASALAPSPREGTALHDALFVALLRAVPERSMIVAFTDGADNMSWLGEAEIVAYAQRASAVLHAVAIAPRGLSQRLELRVLDQVARATGGNLWTAPDAAALPDTFDQILEAMRHRYLLRFDPSRPTDGWHRLDVRLRGAKGDLSARPGYWIEPNAPVRAED